MKKFSLKFNVGFSILAILVVLTALYLTYENKKPSLIIKPSYTATTNVELSVGNGALMKIKNPKYISEIVKTSDIIVKGQIISANSETKSYKLKEGTPEKTLADKQGSSNTRDISGTNYTIKVIETLKGENIADNIVLYMPDVYKELSPELLKNDTYVLCLNWNNHLGKYIFGHPSASFYKIDENQNIESIYDQTSDFYGFTGKNYSKLKAKLLEEVTSLKNKNN